MMCDRNRFMRHRGVAMPLVLISLAMATILTAGYLASRDNSGVLGDNVAEAASARWAAATGLEMGVAILQTEIDWRTLHVNGKLIDDYPLGTGSFDLDVLDLETGQPPVDETTYVELRTTATFDGNEQTVVATAHVPWPDADEIVSLDLSEFAVFASDAITMEGDSVVTAWPIVPLNDVHSGVAIGTEALGANSVSFKNNAAVIDTTVYSNPGASGLLVDNSSGTPLDQVELPDSLAMPDTEQTDVTPPQLLDLYPAMSMNNQSRTINTDRRSGLVTVTNGSVLTLEGDITWVTNHDITITNGSRIYVDGNVRIIDWGDFDLVDSEVELAPSASLTLMIARDFTVDDSYIGDVRADEVRDNTGGASAMNPERVIIQTIEDAYPELLADLLTRSWELNGNSVVKTSMYAPSANLTIKDQSALYGRAAVQSLVLKNDGALFYDPSLDTGLGYLNLDSALYDGSGNIKNAFKSLASLDETDLLAAATSTATKVLANKKSEGTTSGGGAGAVGPNDPTPRTVPVEFEVLSYSVDVEQFEELVADEHFSEMDAIETSIRILSANVTSYNLALFVGATDPQRTNNRLTLSIVYTVAADKLAAGDLANSIAALEAAESIVDGEPDEVDVMIDSVTQDNVLQRTNMFLTRVRNL